MLHSSKILLAGIAAAFLALPALGQGVSSGGSSSSGGATVDIILSDTLTMAATGVAHAAGTALCDNAATACAVAQKGIFAFALGQTAPTSGNIIGTRLLLNNTSLTGASFYIDWYTAAPTMTGIHDASAYSPLWADRAAFVGSSVCSSAVANSDNVSVTCPFENAVATLPFKSTLGTLYAVLRTNPTNVSSYTATNSQPVLMQAAFQVP